MEFECAERPPGRYKKITPEPSQGEPLNAREDENKYLTSICLTCCPTTSALKVFAESGQAHTHDVNIRAS